MFQDSDSQNAFETPGKVLTVNLGHYKLETILEQNKAFIPAKRLFASSSWYSRKIVICICAIEALSLHSHRLILILRCIKAKKFF